MGNVILETRNICKSFFKNEVLINVNFFCEAGEIHSVVGENGAGKSTLMRIISGVYTASSGEYLINGEVKHFKDTLEAQKAGISIMHQEFNLVPYLTVYENIFLGRQLLKKNGNLDIQAMRRRTVELAANLDIKLDPDALVSEMTVAQQQMIEILKAISIDTQIIIMDEPTASLMIAEVESLFNLMRKLKAEGRTIIYISHRLNEIFQISDRVTILKDGAVMGTRNIEHLTRDDVVSMMVGRQMNNIFPDRGVPASEEEVLKVDDLILKEGQEGVSFSLRKGELLCLTGLEGQGHREVLRSLFGLYRPYNIELSVHGEKAIIKSPADAMKKGILFMTDDRKTEGLFLDLGIFSNIAFPIIRKLKRTGFIFQSTERHVAQKYMDDLNIKATSSSQYVKTLSGGNQQKVLIGKCLSPEPGILLVHEPTRGIDVAAKIEVYNLLKKLTKEDHISVIMVSSDLLEVINVSDRILVIYNGKINGEVIGENATEEGLMRMATDIMERKTIDC